MSQNLLKNHDFRILMNRLIRPICIFYQWEMWTYINFEVSHHIGRTTFEIAKKSNFLASGIVFLPFQTPSILGFRSTFLRGSKFRPWKWCQKNLWCSSKSLVNIRGFTKDTPLQTVFGVLEGGILKIFLMKIWRGYPQKKILQNFTKIKNQSIFLVYPTFTIEKMKYKLKIYTIV